MTPPVVSVIAHSGTGKTTLLEKLITELKKRSFRVGVIKHDAHRFDIDHEGKDSWRFTRAGADTMMISSAEKAAMVKLNPSGEEPDLQETIDRYFSDVDIVFTEGYKKNTVPKIEVHRQACGKPLLCRGDIDDPTLIAVASDTSMTLDVPLLDLNNPAAITDFIQERFLL